MAKKLAQIMQEITQARRQKIEARTKELIAEHIKLREMGKA
jgi:hypothetical protein